MKNIGSVTSKLDIFLVTREERRDYLGERYFKFNYDSQTCIQVCFSVGMDVKKGKANNIGIYCIHRMTLFANYMAMDYVRPCTKVEYQEKFNQIVKLLTP